jgi:hypothetical protein
MNRAAKPYVHLPIDAVDTVVYDPEGLYDPEHYDRYATFVEARDAALSSVELLLDLRDYDGEDHREELERMLGLLEAADSFEDLSGRPGYRWFLDRIPSHRPQAA